MPEILLPVETENLKPRSWVCQERRRSFWSWTRSILSLSTVEYMLCINYFRQVTQKWLAYLRREFPTILFKANTQDQQTHLSSNNIFTNSLNNKEELIEELLKSSKALGSDNVIQLIKNYSRNDNIKHAVTVGLIGYPNVGKSSVINR